MHRAEIVWRIAGYQPIEMSPSAEAGEPLQSIHLSFILSIFLVVFRWL